MARAPTSPGIRERLSYRFDRFGVVLNPDRATTVSFAAGDRVVVQAEG